MLRKLALFLSGLALTCTANADWALNMPTGVTELSKETHDLHMLIFWVCVWIGVAVFGVMIYSIFAHRKSKGVKAEQFSHSTLVEIVWTAVPVLILLALAVPTAKTLIRLEDSRDPDLTIVATGYQWKWHYQYQDEDMGFYSSLSRSSLLLTSNDVIHAWWVPELAIKKDAIPGIINETWFRAEQVGTYRGQCAELCGKDHGYMPIVVEVVDEDAYQAWVDTRKEDAPQLAAR